jgi:hypothetical protein
LFVVIAVARAVTEIEDAVTTGLRDVIRLAGEVKDLEFKSGMLKENKTVLRRKKDALNEKNEDNAPLQTFAEVNAEWQDTNGRRFGVVDWTPNISVRVDDRHVGEKLQKFERNIIDLSAFRSVSLLYYNLAY